MIFLLEIYEFFLESASVEEDLPALTNPDPNLSIVIESNTQSKNQMIMLKCEKKKIQIQLRIKDSRKRLGRVTNEKNRTRIAFSQDVVAKGKYHN